MSLTGIIFQVEHDNQPTRYMTYITNAVWTEKLQTSIDQHLRAQHFRTQVYRSITMKQPSLEHVAKETAERFSQTGFQIKRELAHVFEHPYAYGCFLEQKDADDFALEYGS